MRVFLKEKTLKLKKAEIIMRIGKQRNCTIKMAMWYSFL